MNNDQLYPKTIEKLFEKIIYIITNEQNGEKILNLTNWIEWYNNQDYKFDYLCKENEFLKVFYNNDKFALQVWKHNDNVDSVSFNLLSNYYSEYDNDITKIY